jgi:hypothetical protein
VSAPEDTERATKIRDALGAMLADATVSIGPALPSQGFAKPTLEIAVEQGRPGATRRFTLLFGAHDTVGNLRVYLARREGIAATFAVTEARVRPLLDALR